MMIFDISVLRGTAFEDFQVLLVVLDGLTKLALVLISGIKIKQWVMEGLSARRLCQTCKATECDRCAAKERAQALDADHIEALEEDVDGISKDIRSINQELQTIDQNIRSIDTDIKEIDEDIRGLNDDVQAIYEHQVNRTIDQPRRYLLRSKLAQKLLLEQ
jgi:septal ring factor EnvC (AmiA/AmiB activator)